MLFHVNGRGTRCSSFSRIFSTFPETTFLAGHAGGHPSGCPHRAGLILSKKEKKRKRTKEEKKNFVVGKAELKSPDWSSRLLSLLGSTSCDLRGCRKHQAAQSRSGDRGDDSLQYRARLCRLEPLRLIVGMLSAQHSVANCAAINRPLRLGQASSPGFAGAAGTLRVRF